MYREEAIGGSKGPRLELLAGQVPGLSWNGSEFALVRWQKSYSQYAEERRAIRSTALLLCGHRVVISLLSQSHKTDVRG